MGKPNKKLYSQLYYKLYKARALEEKLAELSKGGLIPGWVHSALGQESVGVGVAASLNKGDYLNLTHRGRPQLVGKDVDLRKFLAEAMGKKTGACQGKSGEMHFTDHKAGVICGNGIMGASLPICTGVAFSIKQKKTGQVVVCFFGDGSADQGTFHECLNMASLWKLPILYVCENNGWAQFVPQKDTSAVMDVAQRAAAYEMPGKTITEGNDVVAVYQAAAEAVTMARDFQPSLLEFKVSRWDGHYVGDPQGYRDPEDMEKAKADDPLALFRQKIADAKALTAAEVKRAEQKAQKDIQVAVDFAMKSDYPDTDTAVAGVFI